MISSSLRAFKEFTLGLSGRVILFLPEDIPESTSGQSASLEAPLDAGSAIVQRRLYVRRPRQV